MAITAKKVDEEADFPLDRDEFVDEHGGDPIRINYVRVVPVCEIFEYVDPKSFRTMTDMHKVAGDAHR